MGVLNEKKQKVFGQLVNQNICATHEPKTFSDLFGSLSLFKRNGL